MALLEAPTLASMAVTQVPMFWPMMMGTAAAQVMAPVEERACKIPTEAEEDWITAVTPAPTSTPKMGFVMAWKSWAKAGSSRRGRTAASIWNMPVKSTPKPRSICPTSRRRSPLASIKRRMPAIAMAGARVVGAMKRSRKPPSPPLRRRIWAVTVVPMLAPMMTPMAWRSFITRAFTRPTTMTVAAEEDWMAAVTTAPSSTPFRTLPVSRSRIFSSRPSEAFSRLPPSTDIPYRKRASPPNRLINPKKSKSNILPRNNRLLKSAPIIPNLWRKGKALVSFRKFPPKYL